jgi:hypothetical protein
LKYKHSVRSAKLAQSHESEHTLPIFFPLHNLTGLLAGLDEAYLIDPSPIAAGTCAALVAYGLASGRHLTLRVCLVARGYSESLSHLNYADPNYAKVRILPLLAARVC